MPGELANVVAGRVANLFNFRGPNFTTDAACASGAGRHVGRDCAACRHGDFDAAITGGVDRNMDAAGFVKFCKIGALSATGTRPFDAGADGFVMGEGAAALTSSSGCPTPSATATGSMRCCSASPAPATVSGKGITAPNPVGQRLAVERAWHVAGVDPAQATYIEAHGTSTRVGDATELDSLTDVFGKAGAASGSIALGSVKSNIGHLKGAAGAAGLFKTALSLHEKVLAPSLHFDDPNPNVDWARSPFRVNTELARAGRASESGVAARRRERLRVRRHQLPRRPRGVRARAGTARPTRAGHSRAQTSPDQAPAHGGEYRYHHNTGGTGHPQGAAAGRGRGRRRRRRRRGRAAERLAAEASAGRAAAPSAPDPVLAAAPVRVAIDYADAAELAAKVDQGGPRRCAANRQHRPCQSGTVAHAARPRACSSAAAHRRPRSRSCTPARARSTSTCCAACARREPIVGRHLRRGGRGDDAAARQAADSSYIFVDGDDADGGRSGSSSSCCRPRSPSLRCSPPTSR